MFLMKMIVNVFLVEKVLVLLFVEINCKIFVYFYFYCIGRCGKFYFDLIILGVWVEGLG